MGYERLGKDWIFLTKGASEYGLIYINLFLAAGKV